MSERIYVKVVDLPQFQNKNETFTFGAYFSTTYETVSHYLNESLELLKEINPTTFHLTKNPQLELQYKLTLDSSGCSPFANEITETLKYIRLRRNHFTHLNTSIDIHLNQLISTQGAILNSFWSSVITSLDFSKTDILKFEHNETMDLLKVLRIIVKTLDENLAGNFCHIGIVTYLMNQLYPHPQRINLDVIKKN